MSETKKRTYKNKLRAIDQGTRYDITGNLRRLARMIERGELGEVCTVVCCVSRRSNDGGIASSVRHFGKGTVADALYTVEAAKTSLTS